MERKFTVSAGTCFTLAFMILLLPLQWIFAMIISAVVHEMCHFLAIRFLHKKVSHFQLVSSAARISLPELSRGQELICALAGPVGSFMLLLFAKKIPRIALCGAIQGMFNILPVYPLDGGRALSCLLSMLFSPPVAEKTARVVEYTVYILIILLGFCGTCVVNLGFWPMGLAALLLFRCISGKIPCKPARLGVQ